MKKKRFVWLWALGLLALGCYKEKDFSVVNEDPNQVLLNFKALDTTLLANGSDTTSVLVYLPLEADSASSISFSTTAGTFIESTKQTASVTASLIRVNGAQTRQAKVTFQTATKIGVAVITAKVGDYSKNINVYMHTNYPNALTITPSALTIKVDPAAELTFTVSLSSADGLVTPGEQVFMTVKDQNNISRGTFRVQQDTSNSMGNCSFVYSLMPDTAIRGILTVHATANNSTAQDTKTIYIIK